MEQPIDFVGVKIAMIYGDSVITILRDDTPGLRFAGLWDFPGGSREDSETPFACVAREVKEELALILREPAVVWTKIHPAMVEADRSAYFMVASITKREVEAIVLGDEGQSWRLVEIEDFMARDDVVPHLKGRMRDYLASIGR